MASLLGAVIVVSASVDIDGGSWNRPGVTTAETSTSDDDDGGPWTGVLTVANAKCVVAACGLFDLPWTSPAWGVDSITEALHGIVGDKVVSTVPLFLGVEHSFESGEKTLTFKSVSTASTLSCARTTSFPFSSVGDAGLFLFKFGFPPRLFFLVFHLCVVLGNESKMNTPRLQFSDQIPSIDYNCFLFY